MFSKTKKLVGVALAAVMAASVFAGCGGTASSQANSSGSASGNADSSQKTASEIMADPALAIGDEDNISLKVWGPNDAKTLLEKQCKDFIAMFPDKKIDITVEVQGESDARAAVMKDSDAAADVFGIPSDQFNDLAKGGYLSKVRTQFAADIKESSIDGATDVVTYNDDIYAYPETGDNGYILYYDKSLLTEDDVKSLDSIMAACEKQNKKFIMNMGDGFYSCVVPFTGSGTLDTKEVEEDGQMETYQVLNYDYTNVGPVAKAFSQLLSGNKYYQNDDVNTALVSGFKNGTHAAGVVGPWQAKAIKSALGDNYAAAKLPTVKVDGEDKQIISMHGYKMLCVNAKSDFPITANSLAYYLTSENVQRERCTELGWGPSNKVVAEEEIVTKDETLSAVYAQQKFSIPQTKLCTAFWDPTGSYGSYLVDETKDHSDTELERQFNLMKDTVEEG